MTRLTRPTLPLRRPNVCVRSFRRPSVIVTAILCGGIAMLSLWSSLATPRRAGERASSGRRAAPPLPYQKLRVNLDGEERLRQSPGQLSRDPFRFYVRPLTLTKHIEQITPPRPTTLEPASHPEPPGTSMPWRLMGIVQRSTTRWAVFADCRSVPVPIAEGGSLEGRWRVTAIGVESVTLQSLDERPIVLPLRGCEPR